MKLSHLLIAALVTSSIVATAQNEKPKKEKHKARTERKAKTKKLNAAPAAEAKLTDNHEQRVCLACGRG